MEPLEAPAFVTMAARGAAVATILLGLTVMAGWYAHLPQLVQIQPVLATRWQKAVPWFPSRSLSARIRW